MTKRDLELEERVDEERITLIDAQNQEYEFLILEELKWNDRNYLFLVSCDEKTDPGDSKDPGEGNDITVVRVEEQEGELVIVAVTEADELYELAKLVEKRFGHLSLDHTK